MCEAVRAGVGKQTIYRWWPSLAASTATSSPARRRAMRDALERARARGEIRADADLDVAVETLHGAVFYRLLLSGEPLDDDFASTLADQVLAGLSS